MAVRASQRRWWGAHALELAGIAMVGIPVALA
jgi:hypothetical protein